MEEYERLGALLPELKHSRDNAWMEHLQGVITPFLEKQFSQDPQQQDIVRNYLAGQWAFADSAALLRPIRNEYRYLSNIDEAVQEYRKLAGWDDYACRCMVLFCLTCAGNGTSKPLSPGGDRKRNLDAFVDALIACAGDSSKQLQEVLVQHYLRHPDWEADYLALLGSKKTAQRSLAIRVLADLDREKYRPALEKALAAEKSAKVMDQLSALLKVPAAETRPTRRLRRIRWPPSSWPTPSWAAWAAATPPPPSPPTWRRRIWRPWPARCGSCG